MKYKARVHVMESNKSILDFAEESYEECKDEIFNETVRILVEKANAYDEVLVRYKKATIGRLIAVIIAILSLVAFISMVPTYRNAKLATEKIEDAVARTYFYDSSAVIVDNGEYYHIYDCEKIDWSKGVYIFNSEFAKSVGAKACESCSPDEYEPVIIGFPLEE